jgi:exosome complex component RRP40
LYFGWLTVRDIGGHNYADVIRKVATYIPEKNHFVVGIIKSRVGDNYIVDINAPVDGILGNLEFDGATKRNRPNLNSGDIVFTRVADYSKFIGAKLSCLNIGYSAKSALSELKGGMIIYGLRGKEKLVEEKIEVIKNYCKFEVAFGKNDILWFSCSHPKT